MPQIIEEIEIKFEWSDLAKRRPKIRPQASRSSGVHLSGIIKHCLLDVGKFTKDDEEDFLPMRVAAGEAMEDYLVGFYPTLEWQPGEQSKDGVYGSPDGKMVEWPDEEDDFGVMAVQEFKATWRSRLEKSDGKKQANGRAVIPPPKKVTDVPIWTWQMAGYCCMMQLNFARLHVFYVNGDYRGSGPQYYSYLLRYEDRELSEFWRNCILKNKDDVKAEAWR